MFQLIWSWKCLSLRFEEALEACVCFYVTFGFIQLVQLSCHTMETKCLELSRHCLRIKWDWACLSDLSFSSSAVYFGPSSNTVACFVAINEWDWENLESEASIFSSLTAFYTKERGFFFPLLMSCGHTWFVRMIGFLLFFFKQIITHRSPLQPKSSRFHGGYARVTQVLSKCLLSIY